MELSDKKRKKLLYLIQRFKVKKKCRILESAQFVSSTTVSCLAVLVEYGWVYSKSFEHHRYLALLRNNDHYDADMVFSSYIAYRDNTEAGRGLRSRNIDAEWELSDEFFDKIINL